MRGKNILWMSLIAMLVTIMMVNTSTAPAIKTELYITPDRIPEQPSSFGHVGDEYYLDVNIKEVTDLYSVGFTIKYAPYGKTLTASNVSEGGFLSEGGNYSTAFAYKISVFNGELKVGITRLGQVPGASGSGTLMTLKFTVTEAGSSSIEIVNAELLDSNLSSIEHVTFGSDFTGCTADLIRCNMPDGRHIYVGSEGTFCVKARNDGDVNMSVRARLEFERMEDGRRIRLYSGDNGQTYYGGYLGAEPPYTYLYCDGYDGAIPGWDHWGASPYLDAVDDGNLVNSTVNGAMDAFYSFEDIDLPWSGYSVISNVDFYGYTKSAETGPDVDPYCFTTAGGVDYTFMWCDSMGGTTDWAWTGCRYYLGVYNFPEYYGFPLTEEAVDNMELLLYNYNGDKGLQVDALRARVEFATITPIEVDPVTIEPGEEVELPCITWVATIDHVGKYIVTCYLEYSELYPEVGWHLKNTGEKVSAFSFWVEEP